MIKNRVNNRYGRLVVKSLHGIRTKAGKARWVCLCDCGKTVIVTGSDLGGNKTLSCGCLKKDNATTHGLSHTKEYKIWCDMKNRCYLKTHKSYENYGGRGIKVCDQWLNSFVNFYKDMGSRPSKHHQLDRTDNNKNYEPGNCKWVLILIQNRNQRKSKWWWVNGVRYESCYHAASELNKSPSTIKGWCDGYVIKNKKYQRKPNCYSELKY